MKRFHFKLEPLLKYRKYQERLAQQKTAKAHMDVQDCEMQISGLLYARSENVRNMDQIVDQGVSAVEFKRYYQYQDAVENSIQQEIVRKRQLQRILNEKLTELKQKSVEKKAMETYREKRRYQYSQEMIKNEQKTMDDILSVKTARKIFHETS